MKRPRTGQGQGMMPNVKTWIRKLVLACKYIYALERGFFVDGNFSRAREVEMESYALDHPPGSAPDKTYLTEHEAVLEILSISSFGYAAIVGLTLVLLTPYAIAGILIAAFLAMAGLGLRYAARFSEKKRE